MPRGSLQNWFVFQSLLLLLLLLLLQMLCFFTLPPTFWWRSSLATSVWGDFGGGVFSQAFQIQPHQIFIFLGCLPATWTQSCFTVRSCRPVVHRNSPASLRSQTTLSDSSVEQQSSSRLRCSIVCRSWKSWSVVGRCCCAGYEEKSGTNCCVLR